LTGPWQGGEIGAVREHAAGHWCARTL
jgi:hypothetical protein